MTYLSLRLKTIFFLSFLSLFILTACSVPSPDQLLIAEKTIVMDEGEHRTLNFTTSFLLDDLSWTSSNNDVVNVVNGRITALKEGTATIQVTADTGRFFDTVFVTVIALPPVSNFPPVNEDLVEEIPIEIETPVEEETPVIPEIEVPVTDIPKEAVTTPASIFTITIINEAGDLIQTLSLEEGSLISEGAIELPENFKGFFLDDQTCNGEPFNLETPITEDLTLIKASFNAQSPCIQLEYIVLNGRPTAGSTLSVDVFPMGANVTISWYTSVNNRTYREIPGATESTYTVRPEDSGKFIRVYVVSDSNPPVVRYDTIKMDVFSTVASEDSSTVDLASQRCSTFTEINTPSDFLAMTSDGCYELNNDIDFGNSSFGSSSVYNPVYSGVLKGNGFTIKNVTIDSTDHSIGLFSQISGASIQNLVLQDFNITGGNNVGALIGSVTGGANTVENIHITNSAIHGLGGVGGLIGLVDGQIVSITISGITNEADVNTIGDFNSGYGVGGVIGFAGDFSGKNDVTVTMTDITNRGDITGPDGYGFYGGILGAVWNASITLLDIANGGTVSGGSENGGIIGNAALSHITMSSITNEGSINGDLFIGGIIGSTYISHITMTSIFNLGGVNGDKHIGGIFGEINDSSSIHLKNAYNLGSVSGSSETGGIVGVVNRSSTFIFKYGYNAGSVVASSQNLHLGSIIGRLDTTSNEITLTGIIYLTGTAINNLSIGTIGTATVNGNATPATLASMASISIFSTAGWEIAAGNPSGSIWSITEGNTYPWLSFQGEAPSEVDVSSIITLISQGFNLIYTRQDLENISGSSAKYILMNDIDLKDVPWDPLNEFKGILDGNNYTISNLIINIPNSGNSGLFESIENATIRNLIISNVLGSKVIADPSRIGVIAGSASNSTLSSVHITNTEINITPNSKNIYVGGMVGETKSNTILNITNSSFQGKLTLLATSTSGAQRVGGLIGWSFGISHIYGSHADVEIEVEFQSAIIGGLIGQLNGGDITKSFVKGDIKNSATGAGGQTGGLAGSLRGGAGSGIFKSYNLANVTGPSAVGGLAGTLEGNGTTISESFNKGTITGTNSTTSGNQKGVGGLVGRGNNAVSNGVIIENSYNIGNIIGIDSVGGIMGDLNNSGSKIEYTYNASLVTGSETDVQAIAGTARYLNDPTSIILNSFWDTDLISFTSTNNGSALGKTTAEMQQQNTFSGWDFDDIWTIVEGQGYPTLRNNPEPE